VLDAPAKPVTKRVRGEEFESSEDWIKRMDNKALGMYREGEATTEFTFPAKAEYILLQTGGTTLPPAPPSPPPK